MIKCKVIFIQTKDKNLGITELVKYANKRGSTHLLNTLCSYIKCRQVRKAKYLGQIIFDASLGIFKAC